MKSNTSNPSPSHETSEAVDDVICYGEHAFQITLPDSTADRRTHIPRILQAARHIVHLTRDAVDEMGGGDDGYEHTYLPSALEGVEILMALAESLDRDADQPIKVQS